MAFSSSTSRPASEINVTPLIDVLLVLLIIFMVIVPVSPKGLGSQLPQGSATRAAAPPSVTVRLLREAPSQTIHYSVAGQDVAVVQLLPTLQSLFALRQDHTLFIAGDRSLSFQQVAQVVSIGHQAGAGAVSLLPASKP
jgi:biopolymer transport protein ExbD